MKAIYKRELRSYFTSMIGYVFVAFMLFITGIYFTAYNLTSAYPNFEYVLSGISFVVIILVPILTMRCLAEERKNKTDQMLLTAPVSVTKVVCGKYFALMSVFCILLIIMCLYPLILSGFGTISYKTAYGAIFTFLCLGSAYVAIGLFVSSITESQVIAAVITFVLLLVSYLMEGISGFVPATAVASYLALVVVLLIIGLIIYLLTKNVYMSGVITVVAEAALLAVYLIKSSLFESLFSNILMSFSIISKFDSILSGVFDITSIVYYISIAAFFVFLTIQSIEKRRWS